MENCPAFHSCINFSVKFLWQVLFLAKKELLPKQVPWGIWLQKKILAQGVLNLAVEEPGSKLRSVTKAQTSANFQASGFVRKKIQKVKSVFLYRMLKFWLYCVAFFLTCVASLSPVPTQALCILMTCCLLWSCLVSVVTTIIARKILDHRAHDLFIFDSSQTLAPCLTHRRCTIYDDLIKLNWIQLR